MKKYCVVNFENKQVINKLENYGYVCIPTEKSADVSEPISLHADVLYLKTGKNKIFISECQKKNIKILEQLGYSVTTVKLNQGYQSECKINMVLTDESIVCNPKTCIDYNTFIDGKNVIPVKQGYTKCATIVIDDQNFITEDEGIYSALKKAGKNCLKIAKGYVSLSGYEYGFIGGASAYLPEINTVLFFGDITIHPDFDRIKKFFDDIKVNIDLIKDMKLIDLGGCVKL